jgi:hypothetical protein
MSDQISHIAIDPPPGATVFFRRLPAVIGFDERYGPAVGNIGRAYCLRSRNSIVWSSLFRAKTARAVQLDILDYVDHR